MDEHGFEHHEAMVNGVRFHYVRAGSGPRLVVLLHGFPELWWSWRHQIGPLSEHFTVVAPDLRGYNLTEKPDWGYEQDVLVADIAGLIASQGFDRAIVAGHDWGGQLAWALAITRPWLVERLITLNCPHPAIFEQHLRPGSRQALRSWYMGFFLLPWLPELLLSRGGFAPLLTPLAAALRDAPDGGAADLRVYREALARPGSLRAALSYYRATGLGGTRGMFRGTGMQASMPTLMIWGEDDAFLGVELLEGTERYVPDLHIRRLPGISHWVQQQAPEDVTAAMLEFLTPLTGRPHALG